MRFAGRVRWERGYLWQRNATALGVIVVLWAGCAPDLHLGQLGATGSSGTGSGGAGGDTGPGGGGGSGSDCDNDTTDGAETDVDCGGGHCPACATGLACTAGSDCASGKCTGNVCVDVLLISEVRSRGAAGADDEFVELYNPTGVDITTDTSWQVVVRAAVGSSCGALGNVTLWTGAGEVIPSHGHLLIKGSAYTQPPAADVPLTGAVPDAASLRLVHGANVVDAVCFYFDQTSQDNLTTCATPYVCEGAPALNPHDSTAGSDTDASIERKPGGAGGNATDTGHSGADFATVTPAQPQSLASAATP